MSFFSIRPRIKENGIAVNTPTIDHPEVFPAHSPAPRISLYAVGMTLGLFVAIGFVAVIFGPLYNFFAARAV